MSQEIELKFIVQPSALDALRFILNGLHGEHTPGRQLLNIYYETPDMLLRRHNMGLRIRGDNGHYEMTMKTAGHTTGGLHQRPEYNIALDSASLALARFPQEMWPEGLAPDLLEAQLQPLFSTHFVREKWVVTHNKSRIELALDLGEIVSGERQEPLHELELELLEGDTADLLSLARQLVVTPGLRQGDLSKAARGYHLAKGNPPRPLMPLSVLTMAAKSSVGQGLSEALDWALAYWQYHEELWLREDAAASHHVVDAVALVRHILAVYSGIVPRKASTHLRDLLTRSEAVLASGESAETLLFSSLLSSTRLALTEWLVMRGWQPFLDEKARHKLDGSFKRFADIQLSRLMAELKTAFRDVSPRYDDQLPRLARVIDGVRMLGGVYAQDNVQAWLEPWLALHHAIKNHHSKEIDHLRKVALAQEPFWLHSGQR